MKRTITFLFALVFLGAVSSFAQNKYAISLDGGESFWVNDGNDALDVSNSWTFEAWINVSSYTSGNYDCIMDRRTVFSFYLIDDDDKDYAVAFVARDGSGNIIAYIDCDGSGSTSANMQFDTWYHVAATYDGTTAKLFVNGTECDSSTDPDWLLSASTNAINIGGRYWGSYSRQMEDADIDEVRVSDIARSVSDMQTSTHWEEYESDANTVLLMHLNDKGDPPTYVPGTGLNGTTGDKDINEADYTDATIDSPDFLLRPKYRSQATGNWNTLATWEVENGADNFVDATIIPGLYTELISVEGGNTVTVDDVITANNLIIQTNGELVISSQKSLTVEGTLTNNAGTSGLVIKSDASGTGSLIENSGVSATVERYLTKQKWHFIGIPVESAVAGVFHLPSGHSDIYLKTHTESTNAWDVSITNDNTSLIQGRGYECWVGDSLNGTGISQDETVEFTGTLNHGDYTTGSGNFYGLQYTSGHGLNLLSNPYPSALEADIDSWSKSNVANSVWVWDSGNGNYVYWNGTDGTGGGTGVGTLTGGIIPAMQAFFVEATAASPSMTIPQSSRIHSSQAFYKNVAEIPNTIRLDVEGNGYSDAIFVRFSEDATEEYDSEYDVQKIYGLPEAPQLYTVITGNKLSINSLPQLTGHKEVILGFECGMPGEYVINASQLESFGNIPVYLEDIQEDVLVNLTSNPVYSFSHQINSDPNRFVLHFGDPLGVDKPQQHMELVNIYSSQKSVFVTIPFKINGDIMIYDIMGRRIATAVAKEGKNEIKINSSRGYYIVRITGQNGVKTQKLYIQ